MMMVGISKAEFLASGQGTSSGQGQSDACKVGCQCPQNNFPNTPTTYCQQRWHEMKTLMEHPQISHGHLLKKENFNGHPESGDFN